MKTTLLGVLLGFVSLSAGVYVQSNNSFISSTSAVLAILTGLLACIAIVVGFFQIVVKKADNKNSVEVREKELIDNFTVGKTIDAIGLCVGEVVEFDGKKLLIVVFGPNGKFILRNFQEETANYSGKIVKLQGTIVHKQGSLIFFDEYKIQTVSDAPI